MPSVEHSESLRASPEQIWNFVRDMENWAPFVTGYQRHEKLSETESIWFLKGELGGLTRIAEFKVLIDEWDETGKVRFSLQGINEPVTGNGQFLVASLADESASSAVKPPQQPRAEGIAARLARWLYGLLFGKGATKSPAAAAAAIAADGIATSRIDFLLTLNAGGAAGMILNALIAPMLRPVAEDLAGKIADAIKARAKADA
jgi:carbon monoxide dehydrogenase subunit G